MNEFQYYQNTKRLSMLFLLLIILPGALLQNITTAQETKSGLVQENPRTVRFSDSCENLGGFNCPDICEYLRDQEPEVMPSEFTTGWVVLLIILIVLLIFVGVVIYKANRYILAWRARKREEEEFQSLNSTPSRTPSVFTPHSRKKEKKARSVVPTTTSTNARTPTTTTTEDTPREYTPRNEMFEDLSTLTRDMLRHREYVAKMEAQDKSDGKSEKFQKMGPIIMPSEVEIEKCKDSPEPEIILDKVYYDPKGNEVYDIGSDIDIIVNTPKRIKKEGEKG